MASSKPGISAFWFRRDLRLQDNRGLLRALESGNSVLPVFIFDRSILDKLEDRDDARVTFIYDRLEALDLELQKFGSRLLVGYGEPLTVWKNWMKEFGFEGVYCNRDYEPYAIQRDHMVAGWLREQGVTFQSYKDQVIFERDEVVKPDGTPYSVFTPYSRKWRNRLVEDPMVSCRLPNRPSFVALADTAMLSLSSMGFERSSIPMPSDSVSSDLMGDYAKNRDFPSILGTSRLGVHLRFGTISIRDLAKQALQYSDTFLNELIWREFYQMILHHHPQVVERAFKPAYDQIPWRNDPEAFERWCKGLTGYPLVDAGMRELAETGFMHNRVRMVVASFLSKHILLDWRLGEAWFARKLLDFELASNNGGWQWAAGSGCDAAPYFRVFNPTSQFKKFDPQGSYVRRWVPEWGTAAYPDPIVDHGFARERVLRTYKAALTTNSEG